MLKQIKNTINIYYELYKDVEQTDIYKAFKKLIETYKN